MVRYHFFNTQCEAHSFLADQRKNGKLGYYVGMNGDSYEVRIVH